MKITYKNLLENIKDKPDIKNISDILFQLGHEHEIKKEIFDIEITPNRGDCLSLRGLLRELNLFYDVKINNNIYEKQIDKLKLNFTNNAQDFCPKISFLKVDIDHVPDIYSNQLESYFHDLDITKNNFFTDVSNYVSYETGQPTHCYKYSLFENEIILDTLKSEHKFKTLLNKDINLSIGERVFFNNKKEVINLAGIMGGKNTACDKKTKSVLIECAYFNPEMIIGKTIKYGLNSDAAYKFERNSDPCSHEYVLRRFLKIIDEHTNILNVELYEYSSCPIEKTIIPFDLNKINKIIGTDINIKLASEYLLGLGFHIQDNAIHVPSFRHDINSINDLSEEIARAIGYNNIKPKQIKINKEIKHNYDLEEFKIKSFLVKNGFYEVINDPFVSNENDFSLEIDNPLDSNRQYLRTDLKNSLINNLLYNERRQKDSVKLFEISDIYSSNSNISKRVIGIIASGRIDYNFEDFSKKINERYLKDILKKHIINSKPYEIETISRENLNSKLKDSIIYVEIEVDSIFKVNYDYDIFEIISIDYQYTPTSEYPSSKRDLSFSVKNLGNIETLKEYISNFKEEILKEVFIFDYFYNKKNEEIKIGFRFVFQDTKKTITEKQVNKIMNAIIKYTKSIDGVSIPGLK